MSWFYCDHREMATSMFVGATVEARPYFSDDINAYDGCDHDTHYCPWGDSIAILISVHVLSLGD